LPAAEANHESFSPDNSTPSSPWLRKHGGKGRKEGCRGRPWVCHDRTPPFRRRLCCKNRCVDVGFDDNNCGFCGIRCRFSWRCCSGFCVNSNLNPSHCGSCFNRCPVGVLCFHGMCGYALPLPPFPLPLPPKHHGGHHPPPGGGAAF
ncbi:hypothetical protein Taro_035458, partial [Colocasia esculenta]|nr:hypothetical protein [Colocasia esculenta]